MYHCCMASRVRTPHCSGHPDSGCCDTDTRGRSNQTQLAVEKGDSSAVATRIRVCCHSEMGVDDVIYATDVQVVFFYSFRGLGG